MKFIRSISKNVGAVEKKLRVCLGMSYEKGKVLIELPSSIRYRRKEGKIPFFWPTSVKATFSPLLALFQASFVYYTSDEVQGLFLLVFTLLQVKKTRFYACQKLTNNKSK